MRWPAPRQALGVIGDDVVAEPAAAQARRDRDVVPAGELDRFLAADDRDPDLGMGPLHRARPDRDVLVRPELAFVGEHVLGPGAGDDLEGFLEAGARFGQRHVVHLVFARDAAREAGDQPAVRQAVEHRQLFGQPQRFVQRQQIPVDQEFQPLGALRGGRRHQVGRIHQPVGRAMMLVEADAVIAQPVHLFPGIEVLGVGADRDVRLEMTFAQADRAAPTPTLRCSRFSPYARRSKTKTFMGLLDQAATRAGGSARPATSTRQRKMLPQFSDGPPREPVTM